MKKIFIILFLVIGLFANAQQNLIQNTGSIGIGTVNPSTKLDVQSTNAANFGTSTPCCATSYTIGISENTQSNSRLPSIQFHASGWQEAFFRLASEARIFEIGDNQSVGVDFAIRNQANTTRNVLLSGKGNSFFNGGSVGIGTDNPAHKLDVNGVIARNGQQILYGNPGDSYANIRVIQNGSNAATDGMYINYNSTGGVAADLRFFANGTTERMKISAYTGYVGIGTTNPLQILHVNGNEILSTGSGAGFKFRDRNSLTTDDWVWYSNENVARFFRAGFGDIMTVNTSGLIGVGAMPQAGYKFAVNGNVKAKEVKVSSLNWADFVFSPNYELPTLSEVEKYIKVNKHLPEIPSENEVMENGINLGEMNAKLLQKIEELTLYIIEERKIREKEINILKEEISLLKKDK